jgi:hypothetical protein
MSKNPKPEPDDAEQSARFIETARELEADKNAEQFEKAFDTILPQSPKKPEQQDKSSL